MFTNKPSKNDIPLAKVTKLRSPPCQQICDFKIQKSFDVLETFTVDPEHLVNDQKPHKHEFIEFIIICIRNTRSLTVVPGNFPTWAGMRDLLSESCVPKMQVGFLPFIPNPVTDP